MAKEWAKLDNKTYLITLDEEKKWHDGEPFTAKDVEYSINYIKDTDSIYLDNVKNIKEIEIINDFTIKIHLLEEEKDFEYMLCFPIICERENVGTGNYKIKNTNKNTIELQNIKNQKTITINIYDNAQNLYKAFNKEDVDIIITKNINYEKYLGEFGYKKYNIYGRNFDYIRFNVESKILSNKEVIEVIMNLINKNEIIYKIYNNKYLRAEFPLQYGSYLYNNEINYEYNVNKAQKILEDAGWIYNREILGKKWTKVTIANGYK